MLILFYVLRDEREDKCDLRHASRRKDGRSVSRVRVNKVAVKTRYTTLLAERARCYAPVKISTSK